MTNKTESKSSTAKAKVIQPFVSSLSRLPAQLWARYRAQLKALVTILRPEYAPRLKQFCQDRLIQVQRSAAAGLQNDRWWGHWIAYFIYGSTKSFPL